MTEWPAGVQRVIDSAAANGFEIEIVEYPDGTRTAPDAAAAVGCEVGQIVKSLIFSVNDELVLALTSGKNRVCLLYTSPSPRDKRQSRMPSSA